MSHVFLAVNGDNVGDSIGNAIISDNHDELSRVSGSIKNAHQMLDQWVQAKGGKVVVSSGDEGIYMIPQAAVNELDSIKQKYAQLANTSFTAGVGATMSEASKALIYGKMNNKDQIVHYEPAIDDYISEDPEAQAQEEQVEGDLPNPEDITEEGNESDLDEQGGEEGLEEGSEEGFEEQGEESGEEGEEQDQFAQDGEESEEGEEQFADQGEEGEEQAPNANQAQPAPAGKQAAPQQKQPFGKPAPQEQGAEESEEEFSDDDSEPEHEEGLSEEEGFAHDAEENQDDEEDSDNVEADEEPAAFGGNTEPQDEDFAEDSEESMANQSVDEESEDMEDDGQLNGSNVAAEDDDEEGMGFGDESAEDDGVQELGQDEVANPQAMNPDEQSGVMSEMLHANMGDEESEDSDDEIKQDIIESLMTFKNHKQSIEELKQTNPELYQSQIIMLRAMIQMAKKLQMNPDRALAEKSMGQDAQEAFPAAEDEEPAPQPNSLLGKSEKLAKAKVDEGKRNGEKRIDRMNRGTRSGNPEKGVHQPHNDARGEGRSKAGMHTRAASKASPKAKAGSIESGVHHANKYDAKMKHKQVLSDLKQQKAPNLPKSEEMEKSGDLYHIHQGKNRVTSKPLTLKQINDNHGGAKKLESSGYRLIPHTQQPAVKKAKVEDLKINIKKEKPEIKKQ